MFLYSDNVGRDQRTPNRHLSGIVLESACVFNYVKPANTIRFISIIFNKNFMQLIALRRLALPEQPALHTEEINLGSEAITKATE